MKEIIFIILHMILATMLLLLCVSILNAFPEWLFNITILTLLAIHIVPFSEKILYRIFGNE